MEKHAEIIIYGRVQKAGFRDFIDEIAFDLNLNGYVKNLDDGTVQIICEGEEDHIKELLDKINITQYPIRVEKIDVVYKKPTDEYKTFDVIREEDLTTATYERMDAAVRYMREMNSNLSQKIDGVGGKIDGLGGKIDGLGGKIDGLGGKIDGVGGKIDGLGGKIDGLGGKIDGVGGKIDHLGDDLGGKINGLGGKIDHLGDDLGGKIDGVGGKIDHLGDDLGSKIDGVGGKIDHLGDDLGGKIDGLGGKIDQNRIEITSEIRSTKDDFRSHFDERISMIERDVAQIKAKIMLKC